MKLILIFGALLLAHASNAACINVPERNPGEKWQFVDSMAVPGQRLAPAPNPVPPTGRDIVYEGRGCPEGRICVETMYNIIGAPELVHGQVIVLDKGSGAVVELLPLQIRGAEGECKLPRGGKCIGVYNKARVTELCKSLRIPTTRLTDRRTGKLISDSDRSLGEVRAQFCEGQEVNPILASIDAEIAYFKQNAPDDQVLIRALNTRREFMAKQKLSNVLDSYYVNRESDVIHRDANTAFGPYWEGYAGLTPELRANMINFFNQGTTNADGTYRQGSTRLSKVRCAEDKREAQCVPQGQAGGTMTTLAKVIANARRALRCEITVGCAVQAQTPAVEPGTRATGTPRTDSQGNGRAQ
jgi:hypothetical protein